MNDNSNEMRIAEAAEEGDVDAQLLYGKMLCGLADRFVEDGHEGLDDVHVVRYRDESGDGIYWLEKAAASGNTEAAELLNGIKSGEIHLPTQGDFYYGEGMRYLNGDGVQKDLERAESLLFDAAELGCVAARREVAKLCLGLTDPTYTKGVYCTDPKHWLELAAEAGDGEAKHRLDALECTVCRSWRDYPAYGPGFEWVRMDAESGNPRSQYEYGEILIWSLSVDLTEMGKTGLDYLKRSCENGFALAGFALGHLYKNEEHLDWGDVLRPNKRDANRWFEKSAALGNCDASDELGRMLYPAAFEAFQRISLRQGSVGDEALVKRTYELTKVAAEVGVSTSQMRLAAMYTDGMGVECDDGAARLWLLEAERSGCSLAHECMDKILKQGMSTKDVIEACRGRIP